MQVSQILYRDFLYHSRTSHYLLIIITIFVLSLSVTPFFRLRHSSAEKEGKSAFLDYWQFTTFVLRFGFSYEKQHSVKLFTGT